ncbi:MAG: hypothetical protein GY822_11385 [Deltaproteobacteria bacterium]|nr:hypothetical protein [Deltaproteobacteria bacterium]
MHLLQAQNPSIATLKTQMKALALLDAIVCQEWEFRYFSFNAQWSEGEEMGSMRDGSGSHFFALFSDAGAALVGLDHRSLTYEAGAPKAWVFDGLPAEFEDNLKNEKAFLSSDATFCIWRLAADEKWSCGTPEGVDDGAAELLAILEGKPEQYVDFAKEYFEVSIDIDDVNAVFEGAVLTPGLIGRLRLNCDEDLDEELFHEDIAEIG